MKKVKKTAKLFVLIIGISAAVFTGVFAFHLYKLGTESKWTEGGTEEKNQQSLHVYEEGEGPDTFVFMAGHGIAAPMYEMKGLYSRFSKQNKIAVVERAGYGYSPVSHSERSIDQILSETREALKRYGSKPPYVLVPHSISGIEAIYWAQKYPNEVKAIIALDIGLPKEYVEHQPGTGDKLIIRSMNFLVKLGFQRLAPHAAYNPEIISQTFLTAEEKKKYKALSYKNAMNDDMKNEFLQSTGNARTSMKLPYPKDTPILFISAYTDENRRKEAVTHKYREYEKFAGKLQKGKAVWVKGKHSIYLYAPDRIYSLAMEFMNGASDKN
ncbi:alpha/beta hydrolase [Peribacillus sp. SCS-26]|uniref:alpha/beta hydrolase n=1 Tax=Paraperibacillus marinus TaxID=3115295 RepID=UPI003906BFE0